MKKILVMGSTGMLGHVVYSYLKSMPEYEVWSFSRKFNLSLIKDNKYFLGDVSDDKEYIYKKIIQEGDFDVIINCIGILNNDANNVPLAIDINSFLPHALAQWTSNMKTKIIHMSTDCVFAGNTGPYYESSFKDGISWYDKTKALGELIDDKNLTIRCSIIGPDIDPHGIGLFNWFMNLESGSEIKGFTRAMWTGCTTLTVAKAMHRAIQTNLTGLYHLVNNDSISKFDLISLFNKYFRNNEIKIAPFDGLVLDKTLINTRQSEFDFQVPSYEQMIVEMRTLSECGKQ